MTDPSDPHLLDAIVSALEEHAEFIAGRSYAGINATTDKRRELSEIWACLSGVALYYKRACGNTNAARIAAATHRALPHLAQPDETNTEAKP